MAFRRTVRLALRTDQISGRRLTGMNVELNPAVPAPSAEKPQDQSIDFQRVTVFVYAAGLAALYAPVLVGAFREWVGNEYQSHGIPVLAVSAVLLWRISRRLPRTAAKPTFFGLAPLVFGLAIRVITWQFRIELLSFDIWSIVLAVMGSILIFQGWEVWRARRFPVLFFLAAGGVPEKLVAWVGVRLQLISSAGAATLTKAIGVPILRAGNMISVPGCRLEVADACSGIKKLMVFCAFAVLYGYMFDLSPLRRAILFAAAIPIAVLANTIRVAALIVAANSGGPHALAAAHNPAEIGAMVLAYFMFVAVGKQLGCESLRPNL